MPSSGRLRRPETSGRTCWTRAADALDALEAAGWHLGGGRVQIEIGGGTTWRAGLPSLYGPVGAGMRFTVDRERTEAERVMDPDVVAAKILGY